MLSIAGPYEAERASAELQEDLEKARETAARLHLTDFGAALGTLELGPFQLPNPGGGADLLENASLVLVPGRRYGLIGKAVQVEHIRLTLG